MAYREQRASQSRGLPGDSAITIVKTARAGILLALAGIAASACTSPVEVTPDADGDSAASLSSSNGTPAAAQGVVTTAAGRYAFTPTVCAIGREGGIDDVEIAGPGTGPDGEPVYVELSSTGNALAIGLGVDRAFASAERKLVGGRHVTRPFDVAVSGTHVRASGIALANEHGAPADGDASFEADCRPNR